VKRVPNYNISEAKFTIHSTTTINKWIQ